MVERSRSFGAVADAYDRLRPGYPADALAWSLEPAPGRVVVDLGAGTGKLTAAVCAQPDVVVTAVEPDPAMLGVLRTRLPDVDARLGTAEQIPLPDASVDAVVVGQAWHWFDRDAATAEIARVLRPGGVAAIVWNDDDRSVDWVEGCGTALHPDQPPRIGSTAADDHPEGPAFGAPERRGFPNAVPTTTEGLVRMLGTHSWALIAEPAERDAAFDRLRAYLAGRPETASGEFVLPLLTTVVRTLRR
jgi:SAM-dependent methyltransferase